MRPAVTCAVSDVAGTAPVSISSIWAKHALAGASHLNPHSTIFAAFVALVLIWSSVLSEVVVVIATNFAVVGLAPL
jgi:hypothetical protein